MKKYLLPLLVCVLPMFAWAEPPNFEADEQLQVNARKWAEEFVNFAKDKYEVDLDFSNHSIKFLDDIVDDLHQTYVAEQPAEELIVPIGRALGSYLAEVHRIFNGGKWGWITLEDGTYPGIQATNGASFLPLAKALDRIKTRTEPDLWEYYRLLSAQ